MHFAGTGGMHFAGTGGMRCALPACLVSAFLIGLTEAPVGGWFCA
jgi:hypothetical protein